ncbi:MAG: ATP-binding cassette domain-containing protein [Conexivisphaerales archaeon]
MLLELKGIRKSVGDVSLLSDVELAIDKGEIVQITGRSGAGKTTLLRIAALIDDSYEGRVLYFGKVASPAESSSIRLRHIGYIPQFSNMIDALTIRENIDLPLSLMKIAKGERERRIKEVAERLAIEKILDKYPNQVSGGENQRAAIARAIVKEPSIIIADEPVASLDEKAESTVLQIMHEQAEHGRAVLISFVQKVDHIKADKVYSLSDGMLMAL